MSDLYKQLNEIRLELTDCLIEAQILFKKINETNNRYENVILSAIGQKICENTRQTREEFEKVLDALKIFD